MIVRFILAILASMALMAVVTRSHAILRVLLALIGVILAYLVLKFTGVVDALQPSR
ncbi:MAG: hypothetical protein U1E34_15070 [Amaricoccus sp.]